MATPTNLPVAEVAYTTLAASWLNDLRGAFRILQVVSGSVATVASSTSSTYADTGLTATITPQSTSSLVLVIYSQQCYTSGSATGVNVRLLRSGTTLDTLLDLGFGTGSTILAQHTATYLDSPASTSALTYKTQFARGNGASTAFVQPNNGRSSILLFEVSA